MSEDSSVAESASAAPTPTDPEWRASMISIMQTIVGNLPGTASLGEIVAAAEANPSIRPVLGTMTVQELIDMAVARPESSPDDDEDPEALDLDANGGVIRRRADVPDGDLVILESLSQAGAQNETQLARSTGLTSEQVRLILRQLRSKSYVHVEGSGNKRKIKITRNGGGFLRKRRRRLARSRG
jgi:predicted transcriptional regulator